jgi:dUTP pyrophosphatase
MSGFDVEGIRGKLFEAIDPNNPYTMDEFMASFADHSPVGVAPTNINKVNFKFVNKSNNPNPEYATDGASGFDLRANLEESVTLQPMERKLIPTGLYFEIPSNFEIQVRPRSGLALKKGITVLNTPGTVDADYRGEVGIILINLSNEPFVIEHGERIAQAVIATVTAKQIISLEQVDSIDENTDRGTGGFGSTGTK